MTPRQQKALEGLLCQPTKHEAALYAGIADSTLRTYLNNDEFVEAYKSAVASMLEDTVHGAQRAMTPALETLKELMNDTDQPGGVRVQASKTILDTALKMTDQLTTTERIKAIEKALTEANDEP